MFGIRSWLIALSLLMSAACPSAQTKLPAPVLAALQQAAIPPEALSVVLGPTEPGKPAWISHQANRSMQPASVIKLVTTFAALDMLGPNFSWETPVWLDGPIDNGVLKGRLVIQGQGDPTLVLERLWLLLHKVRGMGVRAIEGDIVLDNEAFSIQSKDPGAFDGEPLRPYNAAPQALLLNFRSIALSFIPDTEAGVARVQMEPPLWGVQLPATIPLARNVKVCVDYRAALQANFSDPLNIQIGGHFAAVCGEKVWPIAYAEPERYNARAIEGLWRGMGGQLSGQVLNGPAPQRPPSFSVSSPPLGQVVRDINKFSNNVMAQQLFLTLGRLPAGAERPSEANRGGSVSDQALRQWPSATFERARERVGNWWTARIGAAPHLMVDNGSGLSRASRLSAAELHALLQKAYGSPFMSELMASLPISGLDGTLKRSKSKLAAAHLKTGSLRGVMSLAGYVHTDKGETLTLVAIVNHERAQAARDALDALVQWAATRP